MAGLTQQLETCLEKLRAGNLTEEDLQHALDRANGGGPPQRLLYLHAYSTLVTSPIEAMSYVDAEGVHDGPDDPEEWPYKSVHEAILDGWRVIKFPEMALMMAGDDKTYGLGCDFILEK